VEGLLHLANTEGFIDLERVAINGWSYGTIFYVSKLFKTKNLLNIKS
jgi:hypothetical protein